MKAAFKKIMNIVPRPLLIKGSYIIRPFLIWYMKGNRFVDPIDNRGYKSLLPYGYENQRENVLSPGTYSLERHRLMWLYLKNETDFFSKKYKVLHIAPEQSFYKRFRNMSNLDYLTSDLESPLADVKADICNLPFEDNSFEVIFCNHVLEHIPDDAKAMSELFRVLKPGGWGILQVPISYQREVTYEDPNKLYRIEVHLNNEEIKDYCKSHNTYQDIYMINDSAMLADMFTYHLSAVIRFTKGRTKLN